MRYTNEQVLNFLPHRRPFLFVDYVEKVEIPNADKFKDTLPTMKDLIGSTVTAYFDVKEDLEILRGHFPGNPILPGVVQVEMMAQASCFIIAQTFEKPEEVNLDVALVSANNCKFRAPVRPGMKLEIKTTLTKVRGPMSGYDCQLFHEGKLIAEAQVLATVIY